MTNEKNSEREKSSTSILDALTGKIAKIGALITAVLAVLAGAQQVAQWITKPALTNGVVKSSPQAKDCFEATMYCPASVFLSEWESMNMRLIGKNECTETLVVYLTFKAAGDRIRIEPRFGCADPGDPSCWQTQKLEGGAVDWKVSPPDVRPLKIPLGDPVKIDINWVIHTAETKAFVDADTVRIQLQDDPGPPGEVTAGAAGF